MDWIRQNFEKLIVLLIGLALLLSAVLLFQKVQGFNATFTSLRSPEKTAGVEPLDLSVIDTARAMVATPATWEKTGPVFNSRPYIVKDGALVDILEDGAVALHDPIPNSWFIQYELDILDPGVPEQDPDQDGFTNAEEYTAKTNPIDPKSVPSYYTKLRLEEYISQPFRLLFAQYTGDTYQVNTLDVRQPSQFLKKGDMIAGTKYKIVDFEKKSVINEATGANQDVSELTLENTETMQKIVLPVGVAVNSPDSFAKFKYLWDGSSFQKKKDEEFSLKPEENVRYKLKDVFDQGAEIEVVGTGEVIQIPKLESQN